MYNICMTNSHSGFSILIVHMKYRLHTQEATWTIYNHILKWFLLRFKNIYIYIKSHHWREYHKNGVEEDKPTTMARITDDNQSNYHNQHKLYGDILFVYLSGANACQITHFS